LVNDTEFTHNINISSSRQWTHQNSLGVLTTYIYCHSNIYSWFLRLKCMIT